MIIDLILDRKDYEAENPGVTYTMFAEWRRSPEGVAAVVEARRKGMIFHVPYNPHDFYMDVIGYGKIGDEITRAMDTGSEEDVKRALCDYITENEYNPEICDYINSVEWLKEA